MALEQKGRGVIRLDLGSTGDGEGLQSPEVMPDKLSEWLASSRHAGDGESDVAPLIPVVGLSLAGFSNSPTGNRVDLIARRS